MPTPIKYTPELIADLQARYMVTHTCAELAEEFGLDQHSFSNAIYRLRKKGHQFAGYRTGIADGMIRVYTKTDGSTTKFQKVNGKWEYVQGSYDATNRVVKTAASSRKKAEVIKDKAEPKGGKEDTQDCVKHPSLTGRNPTKYTRTRNPVVNTENPKDVRKKMDVGGQWVKIDHRTIVYRQNRVA